MKKTEAAVADPGPGRPRLAVAALCAVQFVDVLGVTVVVTALPAILRGLDAPPSAGTLVATGYAMCFGGLLMLGARLGDRLGHRRVLLVSLVGFGAASVLAAAAASAAVLVAARCAQGVAAAASVPTALRLLTAAAPEGDGRRRALAAWSATGAAAGASGFLVGGVLTDVAGWPAVFWVNVPLAVALVVLVRTAVPPLARDARAGLDVGGGVLLTAAVMTLVAGGALVEHPGIRLTGLLALPLAVLLVAALVLVERRAAAPLLPPTAVRDRRLRLGVGISAVNTATTSSAMTLATLYLQDDRGLGATAAGLWLLPSSLGAVAGAASAARVLRRCPVRRGAAIGLTGVAAGYALLLGAPAAEWLLPVGVGIAGAGLGLASVAANAVGTDVARELQGTASGALNTAAQLGTALGVAVFLLLAAGTADASLPLRGTALAWACIAGLAAGTALLLLRARRPLRTPPGDGTWRTSPRRHPARDGDGRAGTAQVHRTE